jgi:predicted alpha/beta hydrolase family esterase
MLPGYLDSDPGHWQTLWERAHPGYRRVQQRDWEHPHRDEWVAALERALAEVAGPVMLVAHSLGCMLVAHWAAEFRRPIQGALLVAPPDVERADFPPEITGFAPVPRERLPFPSILVASTNDPYADFARSELFAACWGSRLVPLGACGHINAEAGFGPWPEGERLLAELA